MPYWGAEPEKNDFAFDSVGAIVYLIMKNMRRDIESVERAGHPEHSIAAFAKLLRVIEEHFPKVVRPSVGRRDLDEMRTVLADWLTKTRPKLPEDCADQIAAEWPAEIDRLEAALGYTEPKGNGS